jgi:hypothetical protein
MGIQAFVPSGGGGTPGFDYIASIQMTTYNRSWAQSGAAGNYVLTDNNYNTGYVYFVGTSTTTGGPLGKVINVSHSFTTINIVAPKDDFMSLYKASVKSTTLFANPMALFSSFPSQITSSGNFVLPNNALPLIDTLVVGGGGGGGYHYAGGGGGGGNVVTLNAYQAVGTTSVTVGAAQGANANQGKAGDTYFGNVYALGGGGGGHSQGHPGGNGGNGGGAGGYQHNAYVGGTGTVQTATTGKGPGTFHGGHNGGRDTTNHGDGWHNRGGGGGGALGAGKAGSYNGSQGAEHNGDGGPGHVSSISGSSATYGAGGGGGDRYSGYGSTPGGFGSGGHGAHSGAGNSTAGGSGIVIVRYYIP